MTQYSATVSAELHGEVGVIVIDNPPVNAISPSVREGIAAAADALQADPGVGAIVLHCAGTTFMAGADIRKLAGALPGRPTADIILSLERGLKPVIAALQGSALGGGLEFALGCHYRCARESTKLGLPEVNIGLIPGAGGTQRLPRLIGMANALELITSGKAVSARQALTMGLIDHIVGDGDLLEQAIAYARERIAENASLRRTSEMSVPTVDDLESMLQSAVKSLSRSRRGELAPIAAVEALRAGATLPFSAGMRVEARVFADCRASPQSRALQHLFMAERQVAKLTGVPGELARRPIRDVGVLGAGTMGRGIAMAFANAGLSVTLVETDAASLARALASIEEVYQASVAKGRITQSESDACRARIHGALELQEFSRSDLVVEAVFEDMALKRRIFADLDRICRPGAILATNTSALDIDAIASATNRPQDVLGLHFFSPAQVMQLVEVVRGARTAPEVLASALALVKSLRKIGVVAGNCDGFIGNRMLIGYRREAEFLLLEGASPAQVDKALVEFGMSMGPHTMGDMAGLDVSAAGRKRRRAEGKLPDDERFGLIADKLVEAGRFGQKTGSGFYRYEKGSHQALADPVVEQLIVAQSQRLNIARRPISDQEIVARCIYPLINEGARILSEQMAQRPGDIDVVWVNGYGFPRARGGPMHYADEIGLANILDTLRGFAQQQGPLYWQPAPLLIQLVADGKTFRSLN